MKNLLLGFIFSFYFVFTFAQSDLNQQVHLEYNNITLKHFFTEIEENYKVHFSYSNLYLKQKMNVSYVGKLENALTEVFGKINLKYKIINDQIVVKKATRGVLRGTLKGRLVDIETKMPIIGALIVSKNNKQFIGTTSDVDGFFLLEDLAIKRYTFLISALAYETEEVSEILINAGKDVYLEIALKEKINNLDAVIVKANLKKHEAINEMALTSSRTFSVEETERYAMSISDPARMAQNYAGVTNAGDDSSNDLVIRGNSPRALLWRLEGIEIPNPNHFGNTGAKGGVISALSSSTLSNSDFYTSTFPTEFGNAISGVFDLKFKNGNTEKREHSFSLSLLGLEGSTQGFFQKGKRASYIVKYRFSTIDYLQPLIIDLKSTNLSFQDFSFKVNLPTKKFGTFAIFALGGVNSQLNKVIADSTKWETKVDQTESNERQTMSVFGISNKSVLSDKTYLRSVLAGTLSYQRRIVDIYNSVTNKDFLRENNTDIKNINFIGSFTLNHKFHKRILFQTGLIYQFKKYDYFVNLNQDDNDFIFFNSNDYTHSLQTFVNSKFRVSDKFTMNAGLHFSYLDLNKTYAIDPRMGIKFKINEKHSLAFSSGLFSRQEHISTYLLENTLGLTFQSNLRLEMNKSFQTVLGYNFKFAKNLNLKAEVYYQYLYDIPVSSDTSSNYSTLNSENIFDIMSNNASNGGELFSMGQGQNYGLDITIEKFFSKKYYAMFTASLFDSKFKGISGQQFRTKFARHFLLNLLGGKEFVVGKHKNNFINLNAKFILNGGNRYTPIDISASITSGVETRQENAINSKQFSPYYRFDLGFNYKLNTENTTHTFAVDVQNVTNNQNDFDVFFNYKTSRVDYFKQLGIIPFVKYKIEFSIPKRKTNR